MAEEEKGDIKGEGARSAKIASTSKYESLNNSFQGAGMNRILESDSERLDRLGITSKDTPEGRAPDASATDTSATAVQCSLCPWKKNTAEYEGTVVSLKETLEQQSMASLQSMAKTTVEDIDDRAPANLASIGARPDTLNLIKQVNKLETPIDHLEEHKGPGGTFEKKTDAKETLPPPSPMGLKKVEEVICSVASIFDEAVKDNPTPQARAAIAAISGMDHQKLSISDLLEGKEGELHSSCPTLKPEEERCLTPKSSNRQQTIHMSMDLVTATSDLFQSNQEKKMKSKGPKRKTSKTSSKSSSAKSPTRRGRSTSSTSLGGTESKKVMSTSLSSKSSTILSIPRDSNKGEIAKTSRRGRSTKTSGTGRSKKSSSLSIPRDSKKGASTEISLGKSRNTRTSGRRKQRRHSSLSTPRDASKGTSTVTSPTIRRGRSTSAPPKEPSARKRRSSLSTSRNSNKGGRIKASSRLSRSARTTPRRASSYGESQSATVSSRLSGSKQESSTPMSGKDSSSLSTSRNSNRGRINRSSRSSRRGTTATTSLRKSLSPVRTHRIDDHEHTATGRTRSGKMSQSVNVGTTRRQQSKSDSNLVAVEQRRSATRSLRASSTHLVDGTNINARRRDRREQRAAKDRAALESFVAAKAEEEAKEEEEDEKSFAEEEEESIGLDSSQVGEEKDSGRNETKSTASSKVSKLGRSVYRKAAKAVGKNTTKFLRKDKEGPESTLPLLERFEKEGGIAMSA